MKVLEKTYQVSGLTGIIWEDQSENNPDVITYRYSLSDAAGKTLREDGGFDCPITAGEYMDNAELMQPLDMFSFAANLAKQQAELYRKYKPLF